MYFITLSLLVHKIFTFYTNDVLLFKCPVPGPKGLIQHQHDWTSARIKTFLSSNTTYNALYYIYFFVISKPDIREYAPVTYFQFVTNRLSFSSYHRLSYKFSSHMPFCKPLIQHLVHQPQYQVFKVFASGLTLWPWKWTFK